MALPPQRPGRPGGPLKPGQPAVPEDPLAQRRQQEELADECSRLEEELEALKARYEAYFLGIERREPNRERNEIKKRVNVIKTAFTRNTGLRFRLQSLHARFLSYERLWMRTAREKEEGTYRRDLFKARLHRPDAKKDAAPGKEAPAAPAASASAAAAPAAPRAAAPAPASRAATSPPPAAAGDARMRALYDEYVAAKKRCNEDVSRLSYDAVARSVEKQVPELMSRYKAKSVDFRVEVKDGKAVLKAIPRL
ncbi:MAG: MXAN_5187 C-terminal domain-containing protein [Anaeromyxobacter sp.]